MPTKKIIVGYDRSDDSVRAAEWALDEAARRQLPLEFFYASEWAPYLHPETMMPVASVWPDAGLEPAVTEMLDAALASAADTHPTVPVSQVAVQAFAASALIDRSAGAALIVLGSRSHSAFAGMLLGSVSVAVSAHARCSVAVIRGSVAGPQSLPRWSVVVGVDDSTGALPALEHAFEQAQRRRLDLTVIRAWQPPLGLITGPALTEAEAVATAQIALDDLVGGWRAKFPGVHAHAQVVAGHPARALQEASRTAQLMVLGSHGERVFRGMTLGSVSQHLLRHADCPVLVVRETTQPT